MIQVEIKKSKQFTTIEIKGHSMTGAESCARVTTTFEMLANLLYNDIDELEQLDGYSKIVLRYDKHKRQIDRAVTYFENLSKLYPNTVKFIKQ